MNFFTFQLNIKHYALYIFLGVLLLPTATLKLVYATADVATPSPENTALIFDLDGVVLKKPAILGPLYKHKMALAKAAISLTLWANVITLLSHRSAGGQYQALFKQEHPELVTLVDEIMQSKEPMQETVALIKELAAAGYSLHIASNMDENDFKFFEQKYPELFSLFKVKKLIAYSSKPQEKPVKKPDHAYFKQLLEELGKKGEKKEHLIFIDDLAKNAAAAEQAGGEEGLSSIIFQDSTQVRQELQERQILKN